VLTEAAFCEHEGYFEQIAESLGGFLDVYEELCNLRQVRLAYLPLQFFR
jgi:hypothetical protein